MEPKPARDEEEPEAAPAPPSIDADMRVSEILSRWPETVGVFVGNGFPGLNEAGHRKHVMRMPLTLRMACQYHDVDPGYMVATLNDAIAPAKAAPASVGSPQGKAPKKGGLSRGEAVGPDHILGDILKIYPETEKVFRKYHGDGCFSCPGQTTESVKQSALLHNVSEKQLLAELKRAAGI
ncbi:MAG: DUF1858 domain-containing protein [Deltaproteobacteria bacterium]|nr:DUF1858 domain-containing protein [Deltaproteobacteria bacterium]